MTSASHLLRMNFRQNEYRKIPCKFSHSDEAESTRGIIDISQIDLPPDVPSGLIDAMDKLSGVKGIATITLERSDIVRHRLVQTIVNAYEKDGDGGDASARTSASRRKER